MNILLFSYYNPLGKGGFEKQAIGLIKQLVSQGHQAACLTVSSPENASRVKSELETSNLFALGCYVIPYQDSPYSLTASILFWFKRNPTRFLANQHPELQGTISDSLNQICRQKEIDVIHCLSLRTVYFLPDTCHIPRLIDLVDSKTQYKKRALQYYFQNEVKAIIMAMLDFFKTLRIEKDVLSLHVNYPVAVVSNRDALLLKSIVSHSSIYTVSHPVTLNNINLLADNQNFTNKNLAFYGFMDHTNFNALIILIKKIMPTVISVFPEVTLKVTGFGLPDKLYNLEKQRNWLTVIHGVDNIADFLSDVTLTCWPFRYGAGVKNKILESMAMGKSVVTTSIGAEAFTENQKKGLLIGDTATELAEHIIYLLNKPEECIRLGEINRQIILTDFTWEKKAEDYLTLYRLAQEKLLNHARISK